MRLSLYDTMSGTKKEIVQPEGRPLGIYACGITAYSYAHIGNLRRYVFDDTLLRTLRYDGYWIKHVQNVTDVGHLTSDGDTGEDKLEKGARREGQSVTAVARKFEQYFYDTCDKLNINRPDVITRATEYIDQQLKIAVALEKKGFAYLIPGDGLYFDTSKSPDYGQLAHLDLKHLQEGARVDKVEGKRNPADFAVWKLEKPGENRQMIWPSPWGERSFPGWHLECVAMSLEQLGNPVDIHLGGVDHIPIHHTNEIAQAQAYMGEKPFANHWAHINFMRVNGQKMSKSLGNVYLLEDVVERGFSPMALRYLFLTSHYRHELNFTWESLEASQKAYDRLVQSLKADEGERKDEVELDKWREQFLRMVNDDLNFPEALAVVNKLLKTDLADKKDLVLEFDSILGLGLAQALEEQEQPLELDEEVQELVGQRQVARFKRDYKKADALREEIEKRGFKVLDTPQGQKLIKLS